MIAPITDRATFRALSRQGHQAEVDGLAVRVLPSSDDGVSGGDGKGVASNDSVRVSYAIGRRLGTAVARNRLRRRLKALVAAYHDGPHGPLAPGAYLFIGRPGVAELSFAELGERVVSVMARAAVRKPSSTPATRS